jgi:hypothetical protein
MVIIGGTSSTTFLGQAPNSVRQNLFLVDLFNNEVHMKKQVNLLRPFAACARGGPQQPFRIYMIGGLDQLKGKWTNSASYLDIVDVMNSKGSKPVELILHSNMPHALIGPSMYIAKISEEYERIYVTGVDAEE